eukprot:snap_masked-scaffold_7-processed-gene-15.28-mRNA-1 protein AED:1.00 eAED:1.00 QI:0/0/0/0/1/1/2/0/344
MKYTRVNPDVEIPFYRENDTPAEREETLNFLFGVNRGTESASRRLPPITDLESEIRNMVEIVKRDCLEEKALQDKLDAALIVVQELRKHVDSEPKETYSLEIYPEYEAKRIAQSLMNAEKVTRQFIVPRNTWVISGDVRKVNWSKLLLQVIRYFGGTFDLVLVDPPWNVSQRDPVRGFALKYGTLSGAEIRSIPLKLLVKNGYFMCWVVKSTRKIAMQWGQEQGFEYKKSIYWVKRSRLGKLQTNTGSMIHSAVQELLAFKRGSTPVTQRVPFFGSDVIESPRLSNSSKPDELKRRIQKLFKKGRFLDLFARNGSITAGWIALGIDLSYTTDLLTVGYGLEDPI